MEELVVEWTLVRRPTFVSELFSKSLGLPNTDLKLVKEQFADDNGRVDLIYQDDNHIFLVELETSLSGKYDFCLEQTKRYKNMASRFPGKSVHTIILYAKDITNENLRNRLVEDCRTEGIKIVEYNIADVQKIYDEEISILAKNIGLEIADIRSDMPYTLSAANRFMLAFQRAKKTCMTTVQIGKALPTSKGKNKGKPWSQTSVVQHGYLAESMGLTYRETVHGKVFHNVTDIGQQFTEKMDISSIDISKIGTVKSSINLTLDQRRILLTQLLKDNFSQIPRHKAMILLFLRFITITRGEWVPKQRSYAFDPGDVKLLNHILATNWDKQTNLGNVLTWSRNYCEELGLIETIKGERKGSERAVMTTLGSRIYGLLELTQLLKREIIHIPQQIS